MQKNNDNKVAYNFNNDDELTFLYHNANNIIKQYDNNKNKKTINFFEYFKHIDNESNLKDLKILLCDNCNVKKIILYNDGIITCPNCGISTHILYEFGTIYKDQNINKIHHPYKRINYFNEWLTHFQAQERIKIPDEHIEIIKNELRKNNLLDKDISVEQFRYILKNVNLECYYDNIIQLKKIILNKMPFVLDKKLEYKLKQMFDDAYKEIIKFNKNNRIDSYSFILHKMCLILGLNEFAEYFPLLKNKEKLEKQEQIWKQVCKNLNWEYIPY